jgi:hypothetical protein
MSNLSFGHVKMSNPSFGHVGVIFRNYRKLSHPYQNIKLLDVCRFIFRLAGLFPASDKGDR